MITIPLTKNCVAVIDDEDAWIANFKWIVTIIRSKRYACRFIRISGRKKQLLMHRVILGVRDTVQVDHKDGDGLNNRRGNIRACTPTQNQANRGKEPNRSSQYKGVCWVPSRNRWQAAIRIGGQTTLLGRFRDECDAATAYNFAADLTHGEFARLNVPKETNG
jgi:HNH endonuclease